MFCHLGYGAHLAKSGIGLTQFVDCLLGAQGGERRADKRIQSVSVTDAFCVGCKTRISRCASAFKEQVRELLPFAFVLNTDHDVSLIASGISTVWSN
ncbi:hypothetical protein D3C86_1791190 [compost metagenome]